LGGSQPLIARVSFRTMESFRDSIGHSEALDRKSVDVESFVAEDWLCHLRPFEYEYRCTEYEYGEKPLRCTNNDLTDVS
jgi:hypothetical protein